MIHVQNLPPYGRVVTLAKMLLMAEMNLPPRRVARIRQLRCRSLHYLQIYFDKSFREALNLLSKVPQILAEIGLAKADLLNHSTLVKVFDRIKMAVWQVLLCREVQLHKSSGHEAGRDVF